MTVSILKGDCRDVLRTLPNASVHCVVTSPPYFGLRDYGNPGQIGLEPTPDAFVAEMVAVFREVRAAEGWDVLAEFGRQLRRLPRQQERRGSDQCHERMD